MAKVKQLFNNMYYDIESLDSIFSLCAFYEKTNELDIYYLLDSRINNNQSFTPIQEQMIAAEIYAKNANFAALNGRINFYNLYEEAANIRLASIFGCHCSSLNERYDFQIVSDIDAEFDEDKHCYIMGYNSLNYDLTMLAEYFSEVFPMKPPKGNYSTVNLVQTFRPTTSNLLRDFNNELFNPAFIGNMPDRLRYAYEIDYAKQKDFSLIKIGDKYLRNEGWNTTNPAYHIRRYMVNTGRHIDVAKLNEKQVKVALKRLLGMSGFQILESDTDLSTKGEQASVMSFDEIKALLAYNVSDVVNLKELFHDNNYRATFQLKKQMLKDYPELIFEQIETEVGKEIVKKYNPATQMMEDMEVPIIKKEYKPDIRPEKVKKNRLTINSSSAQLAAACLCPYGALEDAPVVSFMYPSEKKAKELGIPQVNVLDETVKFIEDRLVPLATDDEGKEIIENLYKMVEMYRSIEGRDFNATHAPDNPELVDDLKNFSDKVNVPYMGPDGHASNCYVTFSVGGLHGAEYNQKLYQQHIKEFEQKQYVFKRLKELYGDANNVVLDVNEKGKPCKRKTVIIDGEEYPVSMFIPSNVTIKKAQAGDAVFKPEFENPKKPKLFAVDKNGKASLDKKYAMTSFGPMNHEDFTSYYPSMLINMSAFENEGLGYDRYAEIFGNKEKFGKLMKDKSLPQEQRDLYSVMRNGTKLILNSASGAADVAYNTPIRMNNRITAMRIIGQLFTWRIGQAQSLEGATVPSTNTDGLYTVFDETENAKILEREAEAIHVGIEPEPIYIVSKDANNRWEGERIGNTGNTMLDIKITAASGGTLACMYGPNTAKALAHPAIMDWALAEFLKWKALCGALDDYDPNAVRYLLEKVAPTVFIDKDTGLPDRRKLLQMYQNVIASNPKMGTYNFATDAPVTDENQFTIQPKYLQHYNRVFYVDPKKVPEEHRDKIVYLTAAYIRPENTDNSPLAIKVIKDVNGDTEAIKRGTAKLKKINGIELNTPCIICNEDLGITKNIELEWLDLEYYNMTLKDTYDKNWKNNLAGGNEDTDDEEEENN